LSGLPQLRALKHTVETSLAVLEQFSRVQAQEFPGASTFEQIPAGESWNKRLTIAEQVTSRLSGNYSSLASGLNEGSLMCSDVLPVVKASHRLPSVIHELNNHCLGQSLLGDYFSGILTNLELVEGTLMYGRLIKNAKLPRAVEAVLVSDASPQNYAYLKELIKTIQCGWDAVAEFSNQNG